MCGWSRLSYTSSVLTLCYLVTFFKFLTLTSCGLSLWLWDIEGGRLQEHMDLIPALGAVQFTVLTVLSIERERAHIEPKLAVGLFTISGACMHVTV